MNIRLELCVALLFVATLCHSQQTAPAMGGECAEEAGRILGNGTRVLEVGDFLHLGNPQCLAVVPYSTTRGREELRVRRGVVVKRERSNWRELLRFENNITNPRGFIGIDFIDPDYRFGFAVSVTDKRSDDTPGFTLFLTYLNPQLRPEGLPVEVSWNRKLARFQEYAPNELNPPGFKAEIAHPPINRH